MSFVNPGLGVQVGEENDSRSEKYDLERGSTECSVQLHCPYADKNTVATDLLEGITIPGPPVRKVGREWPQALIDRTGKQPIRCYAVDIEGRGCLYVNDELSGYEQAVLTARYTDDPTRNEDFSIVVDQFVEFVKLDYREFNWSQLNKRALVEGEEPGRQQRNANIVIQIKNLDPVPTAQNIWAYVGTVYNGTWAIPVYDIPTAAEEVLFGTPRLDLEVNTAGEQKLRYTQKLHWREGNWNRYWRADEEIYDYIEKTETATIKRSYPLSDWANFFPLHPLLP